MDMAVHEPHLDNVCQPDSENLLLSNLNSVTWN